jgi:microcystin degradation protein MlrC
MTRPWRVAVGQLAQETNHFVPMATTLAHFQRRLLLRGDAVLHGWADAKVEVPGFLDVLRQAGAVALPLIAAGADSGGPVTRAAFETLLGEMLERLRASLPVDAVLLALHGAMVLQDNDDPEAEIIARVRAMVGPGVPIAASLDLHGHVTPAMLQPGVILVGYRAYPHVDMFETGQRTARLLLGQLDGTLAPVMALAKRPMLLSPVRTRTVEPPLSEVVAAADAMMASGAVLHAALFPVQPWLDVPDLGFAALVVGNGDQAAAQRAAEQLADLAWARRHGFEPELTPLSEAIAIGLREPGMTLVGDAGDGPTGGSGADRTDVLRALLEAGAQHHGRPILLTLNDAPAAAAAHAAGIGATITVDLGGTLTGGAKVTLSARVEALSDGDFIALDAGAKGMEMHHGASAVLALGALRVAVRSVPGWEWDTNLYRSLGLDPATAGMVFVKSPGHFRVAFEPLAARVKMANTEGPTVADMRRVPWTRVTRPLFPLDPA